MCVCYTTRAEKAKEKTMDISKIYMQETMQVVHIARAGAECRGTPIPTAPVSCSCYQKDLSSLLSYE
jgi:hypothetical protein